MKRQYSMKKKNRRATPRKNPGTPVLNKQGGVFPTTMFDLIKARAADLGTLPMNLCGTSCGSCKWFKKGSSEIGYCAHKLISQPVTARQCCIYWRPTHGLWLIPTKAVSK